MNLLPQASGNRPRLACEISPQGVVAGRTETAAMPLAAVARVALTAGAVVPGLKPGNVVDRVAVSAAIRKAMEDVGVKANSRGTDVTLVLPDAAVRVLLLEFDSLPGKLTEALPIVRFRLKKMLPFDADDAMISYQVMSTSKQMVRVLAVAVPRDVLSEYETAAREAGYEPGSVMPSTLACVAAMDDGETAALLVNANPAGVTTAIVRSGILLLHRSVDLQPSALGVLAHVPMVAPDADFAVLPLVDADETEAEWAAQEAMPEHGRNPYADRLQAEEAVQDEDGVVAVAAGHRELESGVEFEDVAAVTRSPYASPLVLDEFSADSHGAIFVAPATMREFVEEAVHDALYAPKPAYREPEVMTQSATDQDIAEAVNVAAAYFEDTLAQTPTRILCAGPLGAEALQKILARAGVAQTDGLQVREVVEAAALEASAVSAAVPRGWLAGVTGALRG